VPTTHLYLLAPPYHSPSIGRHFNFHEHGYTGTTSDHQVRRTAHTPHRDACNTSRQLQVSLIAMPHHSDVARVPPRLSAHGAALLRCTARPPRGDDRVDDGRRSPSKSSRSSSTSIPDFHHMVRYSTIIKRATATTWNSVNTQANAQILQKQTGPEFTVTDLSKKANDATIERRRRSSSSSSLRCSTMHAHAREKLNGEGEIQRSRELMIC